MFDELKRAINAADSIMQELRWSKDSAIKAIDEYNATAKDRALDDWEEDNKRTLAIKLDMINAIEKLLLKTTKDYL